MSVGTLYNEKFLIETTFDEYVCISYKINEDAYLDLYKSDGKFEEDYKFLKDASDTHAAFFSHFILQNNLGLDLNDKKTLERLSSFYYRKEELEKEGNVTSHWRNDIILMNNEEKVVLSESGKEIDLTENYNIVRAFDGMGVGHVYLDNKNSEEKLCLKFLFDEDKFYSESFDTLIGENYNENYDEFRDIWVDDFVKEDERANIEDRLYYMGYYGHCDDEDRETDKMSLEEIKSYMEEKLSEMDEEDEELEEEGFDLDEELFNEPTSEERNQALKELDKSKNLDYK